MGGTSKEKPLDSRARELFLEWLGQDLEFIQFVFLLLKRACGIRNIDLVWTQGEPTGRLANRHLTLSEALQAPVLSSLVGLEEGSPDPAYCRLINDCGRKESITCAISDKAAEERVRRSGRSEAYECRFGLVDIAVPVLCNGKQVAVLYAGQVHRRPPTKESFVQIAERVAGLDHIDLAALEKAYYAVPVVDEGEIRRTTQLLEVFARYLGNSWARLEELVQAHRRKARESELAARELAYVALEGAGSDWGVTKELALQAGFTSEPDRVLVVRPVVENGRDAARAFSELGWASVIRTVEEVCEEYGNAAAVYMRCKGILVLLGESRAAGLRSDSEALRLARRIHERIGDRHHLEVRVGVGGAVEDRRSLRRSYQEACMALAASSQGVAYHQPVNGSGETLAALSEEICRMVAARQFDDARLAIAGLPVRVDQRFGDDVARQRSFFTWALSGMAAAAHKLGVDAATLSLLRRQAAAEFDAAAAPFEVQTAYLEAANEVLDEVHRLENGRAASIAERARRAVDHSIEHGPRTISIREVAASLGISASHLSRTFRKVTGTTFERYVTEKRMELAKRLLLDPRNNVTQVAERCGFSDPSYFARVFRKVTGLSPREYCRDPGRAPAQRLAREAFARRVERTRPGARR